MKIAWRYLLKNGRTVEWFGPCRLLKINQPDMSLPE